MKRKRLGAYAMIVCIAMSLICFMITPASADVRNPFNGVPFCCWKSGLNGSPTIGSTYGALGGINLIGATKPDVTKIILHSGGGMHDDGRRSYGRSFSVTFDAAWTSKSEPMISIPLDASLLAYCQSFAVYFDGTSHEYNLWDYLQTGYVGDVTVASAPASDPTDVSVYIATFPSDCALINIYLPSDVSSCTTVKVSFTFLALTRVDTTGSGDIYSWLHWPFDAAQHAGTALEYVSVIIEAPTIKPAVYGCVFLLLAGLIGKFVL